jgi:uncharacterized protein (TIGR03437 family)
LQLPSASRSLFDSSFIVINAPLFIRPLAPLILSSQGYVIAAHQDFASLVSVASPALPGEVIHAYGMGFGAVSPQPATGEPGPFDTPSTVVTPVRCEFWDSNPHGPSPVPRSIQPIDVLFAGLAPGAVGLYQLDLKMPAELHWTGGYLNCGTPAVYLPLSGPQ